MCLRGWLLPVAILVSFSQVSLAQTSEWAIVRNLSPGQKVKVQTADGKSHIGKVQSITEDGIQVEKSESIQKADVQQVLLWKSGHRARNALIGLGLGAGVGVVFGTASCGGQDAFFSKGQCTAVAAPLFGGAGAGIGALLPSHGKWREVYRSR